MNTESQEQLAAILVKEPAALTESDAAVLRARSSYLTDEQRTKFAEALGETSADSSSLSEIEEASDTPKKKGK
jgi:hypothetical protein